MNYREADAIAQELVADMADAHGAHLPMTTLARAYLSLRVAPPSSDTREYQDFFARYGVPTMLPPSCLVCGHAQPDREQWAIQHAELPNIIVCRKCRDSVQNDTAQSARAAIIEECAKVCERKRGPGLGDDDCHWGPEYARRIRALDRTAKP